MAEHLFIPNPELEVVRGIIQAEAIGLQEVAAMYGTESKTPYMWRYRMMGPAELKYIGDTPVFLRSDWIDWGIATGRMVAPDA